ncbi:polysaccharide biosynthesis/export family protein [Parablastomonas sp. CN1-191]|uniref:polysaccharide biosynthesis/export family protein n=1 Tax=Parablastomonas sp. CN1-191 TaxID=3400908 RepID=UPI003BF86384
MAGYEKEQRGLVRAVAGTLVLAALAGCVRTVAPALPSGQAAYDAIPAGDVSQAREYPIGPLDVVSVSVFGERDLSVDKAQVDSEGLVQVPLVGSVSAQGLTSREFARKLEVEFAKRYLVNPRVNVAIVESSRRRVTVDGAVAQSGVYEMPGRITLVDAIALAHGVNSIAKSSQVAIVRRVNGQRVGGVFDLGKIQAGLEPDPEVLAGDQVIVGTSSIRATYRELLQATPILSILRPF